MDSVFCRFLTPQSQLLPSRLFGVVCTFLVVFFICSEISAYDGYLAEGTYSLNPANHRQIFLYIPGQTLLYDIGEEVIQVGTAFGSEKKEYLSATTQDGIKALILKNAIRKSSSTLKKFDFFINRPVPFCREESSLTRIWMKASKANEGDGWFKLWPRNAGNIVKEDLNSYKVSMHFSTGIDDGYLPKQKGGTNIEELGYITILENGSLPDFKFEVKKKDELCTSCNERILKRDRKKLFTEVHGYLKASANISMDPTVAIPPAYKPLAKKILKYLGLEAEIGLEAFMKGEFKRTSENEVETTISYGSQGESWQVKSVLLKSAVKEERDGTYKYEDIGTMLIKKIYTCAGNELNKLEYLYVLFTPANDPHNIQKTTLSYDMIKNMKLNRDNRYPALVSVVTQFDHYKLVDYLVLEEKIPKGISNYIIKEINLSPPRR